MRTRNLEKLEGQIRKQFLTKMIIYEQFGDRGILEIGEKVRLIDDFQPYFYVKDENGEYKSLFGDRLRKIVVSKPSEVKNLREKFSEHFEADILYPQRYLIDRVEIPIPKQQLNILYLDIETKLSLDTLNTPEPVITISCYSTKLKKFVSFIWRKDFRETRNITRNLSIYYFSNEISMLKKFLDLVEDVNPHIIAGWNVEKYDLTYLINRMRRLGIDYSRLSFRRRGISTNTYGDVRIYGRVVFDMLRAWRILQPNKLESDSLDTVSKKILGIGKIECNIVESWNSEPKKLIEYNIMDVKLLVELERKVGLIDYFDERRREFGVLWHNLWFSSSIHDVVLLREARRRNIVLPSKSRGERKIVKGATVIQPIPGIYNGVVCLDVKSLYPSIICQFNMSPETLSKDGNISIGNGVHFIDKPEGFLVGIVKKYFEKRKYYKQKMLNCEPDSDDYNVFFLKQYNYKIMLNSLYGYLGHPSGRLYNYDIFRSITYVGRKTIMFMKEVVEEEGFRVIYGDTDSVYVEVGNIEKVKLIKVGEKLARTINEKFDKFVRQFGCERNEWLEVEFEKVNRTMYFGARELEVRGNAIASKKRYAFHEIWRDGKEVNKVGFVGFEVRRSDAAFFTKKVQTEIFEKILKERAKKKDIDEYVKVEKRKAVSGEYSWEQIGIPGNVGKKKNILRGVEWSNKFLGLNIQKNDRIYLIYGCVEGLPKTDVFCFRNNKDLEGRKVIVNWDRMFQVLIDNKLERIYEALKWDDNSSQKNLNSFGM